MSHTAQTIQAITPYRTSTTRARREAVLIIAHGDGWIEAYAERHIDVQFAIKPYLTGAQGEILAEQYLDETLPRRYADLLWPGKRRACGMVRKHRPSDIAQTDWQLELLRTLDHISDRTNKKDRRLWVA